MPGVSIFGVFVHQAFPVASPRKDAVNGLLPHAVNCRRFCFWRHQSVVFLFVYEISWEQLKGFASNSPEDVSGPSLGRV